MTSNAYKSREKSIPCVSIMFSQVYEDCRAKDFVDSGVLGMGNYGVVTRMRHAASGKSMAIKVSVLIENSFVG